MDVAPASYLADWEEEGHAHIKMKNNTEGRDHSVTQHTFIESPVCIRHSAGSRDSDI